MNTAEQRIVALAEQIGKDIRLLCDSMFGSPPPPPPPAPAA